MRIASESILTRLRVLRLLLTLLLGLGAGPARAAMQFDVFVGYDGVGREACWMPIVCEIKNDSLPINGFVEIENASYSRGQTYRVPVELPTGTLKRVTIPVFAPSRHSPMWNVRLVNEKGKTISEQTAQRTRRQVGWEIPLMGSLPRTASGAPSLPPILRDQSDAQPVAARFQTPIFPDNPLVLEGLNAIYLNSEVVATLRSSQVDALIGWMNAGGHLIVAVEQASDVTASQWLNGLMPCEPTDLKTIAGHTEFQAWLKSPLDYQSHLGPEYEFEGYQPNGPQRRSKEGNISQDAPFANIPEDSKFELADMQVATGKMRDGKTVVTAGGVPVIVTATRGLGRITALMFSPEREPFKSWKNLPTFWSRMLEVPGRLYASSDYMPAYGQSPDGIFGALIDSRQIHKLPIGWLLLLLIVYLGVIGPFDQWWLKRIGKPMLTWITFPCYVAIFSVMIYIIGYKLRAGESEYNELHLVDVLRNGDHAELRGRTYMSIYSPSNAKFPLESKQKFATLRGEFLGMGSEATDKASVTQNGDSFKAEVMVPVWTSQLYLSDWWQSSDSPFDVNVTATADGWSVTIKNNTEHAVKGAHLIIAGRVITLEGEIAPGASGAFTAKMDATPSLSEFVQQHNGDFQRATRQRQSAFGASKGGRLEDAADSTVTACFLSQMRSQNYMQTFILPPGLDLTPAIDRGNAVLLVWTPDTSPIEPINKFKPRRSAKSTLWRIPVSTISKN